MPFSKKPFLSNRIFIDYKPGGQKGHKRKILEMTDNPDKIIVLHPDYCSCCGLFLSEMEAVKDSPDR